MRTLFAVRNITAEDWPAYGMARLGAVIGRDGANEDIPLYELVKPDGAEGIYVVNGAAPLLQEKEGTGVHYFNARYVAVAADKVYTVGDTIGSVEDQWEAGDDTDNGGQFHVTDEKNDDDIAPVVALATGGTSTPGGGSGGCACFCIENGDIEVGGIETTKKKSIWFASDVTMNRSAHGHVIFPYGYYEVTYSAITGNWKRDIGDILLAVYNDGSSATSATTMDGSLTYEFPGPSRPTVTLTVTASVAAPPPPP